MRKGRGTTRAAIAPRVRLVAALALTACETDCNKALSDSARNGHPQVLATVTYDTAYGRPVPTVVYRDSLQTVRILADTIRLSPAKFTYSRRTVYGIAIGGGPEMRQGTAPVWITRAMYEVNDVFDRYVVLDSFDIVPGLPPGSARWDSNGGTVANVVVQRAVYLEGHADTTYRAPIRAWQGVFVPAR